MEKPTTHIALTGHRPVARGENRLFGGYGEYNKRDTSPYYQRMRETLRGMVDDLLESHEHLTLHSGMALGVDTVWAEVILEARQDHPDRIAFTADVPTLSQAAKWGGPSQQTWRSLTRQADQLNVYADEYRTGVEELRNKGMIVGADTVIAVADGRPSGTQRAIQDAIKAGAELIQLDPAVFEDEFLDVESRRAMARSRPATPPDPAIVKSTPVRVIEPRSPQSQPGNAAGPSVRAFEPLTAKVLTAQLSDKGGVTLTVNIGDGKPRPVIIAPGKGSAKPGQHIVLTEKNVGIGRGEGKFFIGFRNNPDPVVVAPEPDGQTADPTPTPRPAPPSPAPASTPTTPVLDRDVASVGWLLAVNLLDRRIAEMAKAGVDSGLISRAVAPVGLARTAIDAVPLPLDQTALAAGLDALARPRITELAKYIPEADAQNIIANLVGEAVQEASGARRLVEALKRIAPDARPLTSIDEWVSRDLTVGAGLRLYALDIDEGGSLVITRFPFDAVGLSELARRRDAPRDWETVAVTALRGVDGGQWLRSHVYETDWAGVEEVLAKADEIHSAEAKAAGVADEDQRAYVETGLAKDLEVARALLEHLDRQGLAYRVKAERSRVNAIIERPGQPKAEVRLLDPLTPQFVGQVEIGRMATTIDQPAGSRELPTAAQAVAATNLGLNPSALAPANVMFREDKLDGKTFFKRLVRVDTVDGPITVHTGVRRGLEETPRPLEAYRELHLEHVKEALLAKYPEAATLADASNSDRLKYARALDRAAVQEQWFVEQVTAARVTLTQETKLDDLMAAADEQTAAGQELVLPAELVSFDEQIAALQRTLWQRIVNPLPGEDAIATLDRWVAENLVAGEADNPASWAVDIDSVARFSGQNAYAVAIDLAEYLSESTPSDVPLANRLLGEDARRAAWLDRMTKFDPTTAQPWNFDEAAQQVRDFGPKAVLANTVLAIRDTLDAQGITNIGVQVDEAGVIQWSGTRHLTTGFGDKIAVKPQPVVGQLGKVFEMGNHGEIYRTSPLTGEVEIVVPGYTVDVAQGPGSFYERMRLVSYVDQITAAVEQQVCDDLLRTRFYDGAHRVDSSWALTRVLTNQYDVRLPGDYLSSVRGNEAEYARRTLIVGEYSRRVRMGEAVSDSFAETWRAGYEGFSSQAASRHRTDFVDLGMRTPAILDIRGEGGIFDGDFTNDSDPGRLRLLAAAAEVDAQGRVSLNPEVAQQMVDSGYRASDSNLVKLLDPDITHNAMDRRRMAKANVLAANSQTAPTYAAQIALHGWTMEDGFVVSKAFAEANAVPDPTTGTLRPLTVGDKLSDHHGNKGVIAYVAGTESEPDEYVDALFDANPDLGVVYSPLSPLSRFNGGLIHEAVKGEVRSVVLPDGQQPVGAAVAPTMAPLGFIVSHMTVDVATKTYGDDYTVETGEIDDLSPEEQASRPAALFSATAGKLTSLGRSFSAQAAWVLSAKGADKIAAELFASKGTQLSTAAEYLQMVGVALKTDGSLALIDDDALKGNDALENMRARGDRRAVDPLDGDSFAEAFGQYGGDMIIPAGWDLTYPNILAKRDEAQPAPRKLLTLESGEQLLPVLPASLRVGHSGMTHEYSEKYQIIFEQVKAYAEAGEIANPKDRAAAQTKALNRARKSWETLTGLVVTREIASKQGVFRKGLLSASSQNSANAVWSADPRLDLDEVAVSPQLATSLGLSDHRLAAGDGPDQRVLIWRDPVQHDGGVRYMKVRVDPAIKGVRINPVMVKSFDGDFDGDPVGLIRLTSQEAFTQAVEKFDPSVNLLDRRAKITPKIEGYTDQTINPLNLHTDADLTLGETLAGPRAVGEMDLATWREQINLALHQGAISPTEGLAQLNSWAHLALRAADARLGLRFDDVPTYLDSVKAVMVDTGAKGNEQKLANFAQYVAGGHPVPAKAMTEALANANRLWGLPSGDFRDWDAIASEGVNAALVVKKSVGLAGAKQYQAVRALRGRGPEVVTAALGLSAAVNQGLLQAKHDPVQAMGLFTDVRTAVQTLWDGDIPSWNNAAGRWRVANGTGKQRTPVTTDQWVEAARMVFAGRMGLNVSDDMIRTVADALAIDGDMSSITAERGAPLDMIAYVEGVKTNPLKAMEPLLEIARRQENLYDGPHAMFAPAAIRRAKEAQQAVEPAVEPEAITDPTAVEEPRRADEGRRYNDAEARRAEREELFNPSDPAKVTYRLVELPSGEQRMVAVNIPGVEPDTLGGVVAEGVRVAHDGSWIEATASVSGRTTLEAGTQVLGDAQVRDSHLIGCSVQDRAEVTDCKLRLTWAMDNARLARIATPHLEQGQPGDVRFSGNSRTYLVTVDSSGGPVEIGGEAYISGRMHSTANKTRLGRKFSLPTRVIGAGQYMAPEDTPTYEIQNGRLVAVDIPGVATGAVGAKVSGRAYIQHDGSWADETSVLHNVELVGSRVEDSFVADTKLFSARVSDCVVAKSTLRRWTAQRVQIDQCSLDTGNSTGEDKDTHGLTQVHTTGHGGITVVNSEIERLSLDASEGPVELDGVWMCAPVVLGAGQWGDASAHQAAVGTSNALATATASLAV
jgi:hypothetical protein